jgi:hypothetical protein
MIGRLHLKVVFSIVLLAALVANQSGLAKSAHTHHTSASSKAANSVHTKPAETIDTSVTVLPPRGRVERDKRNSNASLKIVKPGKKPGNLTQRPNVTATIKPFVVRNAIGQPIKSNRVGASHLAPPLQAPGKVAAKGDAGVSSPISPIRPLNVGSTNAHPNSTASISSKGRIDGARMIRPSAASLGIGGPTRVSNGINGTTIQTKH